MRRAESVYLYNAKPRGYYSESEVNKVDYVEEKEYEVFKNKIKNLFLEHHASIQELYDMSKKTQHSLQYFEDRIKHLEGANEARQRGGVARIVVKKGRNTVNIKLR